MAQIHDTLIRPIASEKGSLLEAANNTFVFEVGLNANKLEIKQAVERFFGVRVTGVRTAVVRGKFKRFGRFSGRRSDWKKAYVTLADGDSISIFSPPTEADKA